MSLTHQILNTIKHYEMLERGDRVLVCVSGGPDSVFLVHALSRLKNKLGITLAILHMDHGVRGAESRRDAGFVRKLAKSLGMKFVFQKLDLKRKKSKLSLEEMLRENRYNFFKKSAAKLGFRNVATAHTLDDQAETVLMRVIKGASLKGAAGIQAVRCEGRVKFIRPLLGAEKKDIVSYLKKNKIPFRIDRTNLQNKFLRNRVRNEVLPYLEKINPRVKRSLFNLAESLREDYEFIEEERKKRNKFIRSGKKEVYLPFPDIFLQPKAIRKEILRTAFGSAGGSIKKLSFRHWKDMDFFIKRSPQNKSLDLPGGVKLSKRGGRISFTKNAK